MKKGTWVVIFYDLKDELYDKAVAYQIGDDIEEAFEDIREQAKSILSDYMEGDENERELEE